MGLTRSREPAAWSLRHPHTNVSAGVLGGDLPLALGLVQPGHSPGFSLMWPTKLCPRPPCHPAALGRRWGCFPSAWFTCPFPPSPRMTRVDLKNYLEHIYSVPVASVRTRVQHGGCLGWAAPCRMCGPPPRSRGPRHSAPLTDIILVATPWVCFLAQEEAEAQGAQVTSGVTLFSGQSRWAGPTDHSTLPTLS